MSANQSAKIASGDLTVREHTKRAARTKEKVPRKTGRSKERSVQEIEHVEKPSLSKVYDAIKIGNFEEAEKFAVQVVTADSYNPEAHVAMAEVFNRIGKVEDAIIHGERAIALSPYNSNAKLALASALTKSEKYLEGKELLNDLLKVTPGAAKARWLRGFCNLGLFNFIEGFEDYEYGYIFGGRKIRGLMDLRWRGEKTNGLLIHAEQGLGDQIQFARFVPMARELSQGQIFLEVDPPLIGIFQNLADRVWANIADGSVPVHFDAHVSIHSLPYVLGIDEIDGSAYLDAPKVSWDLQGAKVGFCWKGNPRHGDDGNRSLTLEEAGRFKEAAPFIIIQPEGETPFEAPCFFGPDMAATASLLKTLDLLVTVDTSLAHLAGALGKECWLIVPKHGEWRWGIGTVRSPWYNSIELFRCSDGDRSSQIDRIKERLKQRFPKGIGDSGP